MRGSKKMTKYLYVVDSWIPFPTSEYGGVIILISETDSEAFEILLKEESLDDRYNDRIMPSIKSATKLELKEDYESGILQIFVT